MLANTINSNSMLADVAIKNKNTVVSCLIELSEMSHVLANELIMQCEHLSFNMQTNVLTLITIWKYTRTAACLAEFDFGLLYYLTTTRQTAIYANVGYFHLNILVG